MKLNLLIAQERMLIYINLKFFNNYNVIKIKYLLIIIIHTLLI